MAKNRVNRAEDGYVKLIYNPNAGKKRRILNSGETTLEEIREVMEQYQILTDFEPTKYEGHAVILAKESIKEGYKMVIAAGGDGTIGEVANGLIGSDVTLGVLPLGTFMNISRMLSIPPDLEKAVAVIKIGRTRKIDVGVVVRVGGEKLLQPHYFLENAGLGLEAQIHEDFYRVEHYGIKQIFRIFRTIFDFYGHKAKIVLDGKTVIETRAPAITISNGPFTGASLPIAPKAKLNDHRLTVSIYRMGKWGLVKHFINLLRWKTAGIYSKVDTYKAKTVRITTKVPRLVHADARLFDTTPVEFKVFPNALSVVAGFPKTAELKPLEKRTYLDP